MPNKRGDGETNIQKYGYLYLKKIKNIAPNVPRLRLVANQKTEL